MPANDFRIENATFTLKHIESENYKNLVELIEESQAYQSPYTKICINKAGIYFGHTLLEIAASFPIVNHYLGLKKLNEKQVTTFLDPEIGIYHESNRSELTKLAKDYFKNLEEKQVSKEQYNDVPKDNPDDALMYLLEKNKGAALGEDHSERASKKLLFDNMPFLKKAGVTTIYFEHLLDTQTEMLNDYLSSPEMDMPIMLKDYLMQLDKGHQVYDHKRENLIHPYTFLGLIIQAKKYGIRIVTFDTRESYDVSLGEHNNITAQYTKSDNGNRCLYMNYLAAKTIAEDQKVHPGKYIIHCGERHMDKKTSGITGMSEIFGIPTLEATTSKDSIKIEIDSKVKTEGTASTLGFKMVTTEPNVLIYMPTSLSDEAKLFLDEQEKLKKSNSKLTSTLFNTKQFYVSSETAGVCYQIANAKGYGDQIAKLSNDGLGRKNTKINKTLELLGIQVFNISYHKTNGYWITASQEDIEKLKDICNKHIKILTILKNYNSDLTRDWFSFLKNNKVSNSTCEKLLALIQTNQQITLAPNEFNALKNNQEFTLLLETYPNLVKDAKNVHSFVH